MKQKLQSAKAKAKKAFPYVVGVVGAVVTITVLGKVKPKSKDLHVVRLTPDQLDIIKEAPESVVGFMESRIIVGNTASTEVF